MLCATSTVVAAVQRYLESGREGLVDRRARNRQRKVDERFRATLCRVLKGTPQQSGWRRTTWTRELLAREVERRGARLSYHHGTRPGVGGRTAEAAPPRGALPLARAPAARATVATEVPGGLRPARGARLLRGRDGRASQPQGGARLDAARRAAGGRHSGQQPEAIRGRSAQLTHRRVDVGEGGAEDERPFHRTGTGGEQRLPHGQAPTRTSELLSSSRAAGSAGCGSTTRCPGLKVRNHSRWRHAPQWFRGLEAAPSGGSA
nr:helix-turn-helix domain-containing protein [Corallococcus exiguus]